MIQTGSEVTWSESYQGRLPGAYCSNGFFIVIVLIVFATQFFVFVLQRCTWPWAAICHVGSPPTTTTTTQAPFLPNGCPSDFNVHLLLPHGTDCSRYYQCSNGEKIARSCGPGDLFDINLGVSMIFELHSKGTVVSEAMNWHKLT